MGVVRHLVKGTYHQMQRHYATFRILVWLKEHGVTRRVNSWFLMSQDTQLREAPSEEMQESRRFFRENKQRISDMLALLADEKSRTVWKEVVRYRMGRVPINPQNYSEDDQYFVKGIIRPEPGEIFLDGGGYTGDTVQQFLDTARKERAEYKRIVVFEPDRKNFQLIKKFYGKKDRIFLIQKGLSDAAKTLFLIGSGVAAKLAETGGQDAVEVPVVNIDSLPQCRDATWIKMDIEGAEMDALHGAQEVIRRNHPKLTISIYHSDEDMIRIIEYVHELVPEYRLYVRHHSRGKVETVLYAVI